MKKLHILLAYFFAAKALFGIVYLLMGWETVIEMWLFPNWLVILAVIVDTFIAYKLTKVK